MNQLLHDISSVNKYITNVPTAPQPKAIAANFSLPLYSALPVTNVETATSAFAVLFAHLGVDLSKLLNPNLLFFMAMIFIMSFLNQRYFMFQFFMFSE